MEAEKEQDPFASIVKLCQPTASQEAKLVYCPLVRESENFADLNSEQCSSSPDPTPSEPAGILMVSPPDSPNSVRQEVEDDAEFHTPPEHHFYSNLPSSEDQSLDEVASEGARVGGVGDGPGRRKRVRVSEGGLDDQPELKKIGVSGEEFDGDTVPVCETEVIGNESVRETVIIDVDSSDSDEETGAVNLARDSLDIISESGVEVRKINILQKTGQSMKDCIPEVNATDENRGLRKERESVEDEKSQENSASSRNLDSGKTKEKDVKLKYTIGNQCTQMRRDNGNGGSEKVRKAAEGEKTPTNACEDGDLKTHSKRIEEIDKFRYVGGVDIERKLKGRTDRDAGGSGRRRQLPVSMNGNRTNEGGGSLVENRETNVGLLDFCDVLKVVLGDANDDSADVNFLETAKRQGLTFPRVRWWPPEDDDE